MVGPEVTGPLRMAVVKGKKLIVKLTLDDLDEIIGYIAAEANHTDDKKGASAIQCWWLPRNPLVC